MQKADQKREKGIQANSLDSRQSQAGPDHWRVQLQRDVADLAPADQARALMPPAPTLLVQPSGSTGEASADSIKSSAAYGIQGSGGPLPHLDRIQPFFPGQDLSSVQAHVGGRAAEASQSMGASAYATGNHVAFRRQPDLHTAAHEAAHVVQQRGGVSLSGGIGEIGDRYEIEADQVADLIVQGKSAEGVLNEIGKGGASGVSRKAVQLKRLPAHQRWPETQADIPWKVIDDAVSAGAGMDYPSSTMFNAGQTLTEFGVFHNKSVPKIDTSVEAGTKKIKQKLESFNFIINFHCESTLPDALEQNKETLKKMDSDTQQKISNYIKNLDTYETNYNTEHLDIITCLQKIAGYQDKMKAAMARKKSQLTSEELKEAEAKYGQIKGAIAKEIAETTQVYGGAIQGIVGDLPTLAANPAGAVGNLLQNLGKGVVGRFMGEVISIEVNNKYKEQLEAAAKRIAELNKLKKDFIIAEFQDDINAYGNFIKAQETLIKKHRVKAKKARDDYFYTMTQLRNLEKTWREKFGPKLTKRESDKLEKDYKCPRKRYKQYQFNLFGTALQVKGELDTEGQELVTAIEAFENDLSAKGGVGYHNRFVYMSKQWGKVDSLCEKYAQHGGGHKWVKPFNYVDGRVNFARWVDTAISNYVRFLAKTKNEVLMGNHLRRFRKFYKHLYKEFQTSTPKP